MRRQRANDAQMDKLKGATSHLFTESYMVEASLAAHVTYTRIPSKTEMSICELVTALVHCRKKN